MQIPQRTFLGRRVFPFTGVTRLLDFCSLRFFTLVRKGDALFYLRGLYVNL